MSTQARRFYEFDHFRVDETERVLLRAGEPVYLPPKVFDTLLALVRRSGHIIGKSELMQAVWPDAFVEESNLTQYISVLRRTLGDGRQEQRYIETVPRRGYRFAADVHEAWDEGDELLAATRTKVSLAIKEETEESAEGVGARAAAVASRLRRSGHAAALAALVVATAGVAFGLYQFAGQRRPARRESRVPPVARPAQDFTLRTFDPGVWPRADEEIGVEGFRIEDFEDAALVEGLQIELSDTPEAFGPTGTLPVLFNPDVNDTGGARVFVPGVWDGSRVFINRRSPPPHGYADFAWGDVTFHIQGGATSFGFSLDDMDLNTELFVNGVSRYNLRRLLPSGTIPNGYVRIDAAPGKAIYSVKVTNNANDTTGDGMAFDHVAFSPLRPQR
jgi:DNA-binding winged helix-turn-helix (wHTH) protein